LRYPVGRLIAIYARLVERLHFSAGFAKLLICVPADAAGILYKKTIAVKNAGTGNKNTVATSPKLPNIYRQWYA
jgi:hypothetical protein